ncbi:MAG: hypothetical protein LBV49_12545 [Azonexus sp.]|nr:hypothetical protein [Azonexus sp.]
MADTSLTALDRLLVREGIHSQDLLRTQPAKRLDIVRNELVNHIQEVRRSGNLPLIIATERTIVDGDLERYANSKPMANSLSTALNEIKTIERNIPIVDDPSRYQAVDQAHSLPRNRKNGLPFDEARQALASHHARLNNMDKARLGDDEKKIIEARKAAIATAGKLYAARQAKALGVDLAPGDSRTKAQR